MAFGCCPRCKYAHLSPFLALTIGSVIFACWYHSSKGESACKLHLADEQYELARLLGDPLGARLVGVGLVPCSSQLAQAHCHALLHLAQPSLNVASCLHNTACLFLTCSDGELVGTRLQHCHAEPLLEETL